ncbi:uncharacterized protein BDV14DRAFT_204804 [Aspergillus stella-maris]|uniref:uncharacterized protein n=1 Tax=Aspergillus stella-maris TaxID=1810926 RepID=UPI003CCCBCF7
MHACHELQEDREQADAANIARLELFGRKPNRTHPVGDAHFSKPLPAGYRQPDPHHHHRTNRGPRVVISLARRTSILPWLPEIKFAPAMAVTGEGGGEKRDRDPHLILSDDSAVLRPSQTDGGPCGPWNSPELGGARAQFLHANAFTESLIWLFCRDFEHNDCLWPLWVIMLYELRDDPDGDGSMRFKKTLRPDFQSAWDWFNNPNQQGNCMLKLVGLRERLIAAKKLTSGVEGVELPAVDITPYFKRNKQNPLYEQPYIDDMERRGLLGEYKGLSAAKNWDIPGIGNWDDFMKIGRNAAKSYTPNQPLADDQGRWGSAKQSVPNPFTGLSHDEIVKRLSGIE